MNQICSRLASTSLNCRGGHIQASLGNEPNDVEQFAVKPIFLFDDFSMGKTYGFKELTLADMLRDPIVQNLMRSDGVSPSDVRQAFSLRRLRNLDLAA
jgi:hypothetical protein